MSIFNRGAELRSLKQQVAELSNNRRPQIKGYFEDWLGDRPIASSGDPTIAQARASYAKTIGDGTDSNVLMAVVLWITRRIAESPIGVVVFGDEEYDFEHDLSKLLRKPNPWYSGAAYLMAQAICFTIDGNAYSYKVRNRQLKPIQLLHLPNWSIEPHIPETGVGYIDYYSYYPDSKSRTPVHLLPEDIVHLRYGIDPSNTRKGISPLKLLLSEIYTDEEASMFTALMLKNMGVFGMVISPATEGANIGAIGDDPKDVKKYVKEEFAGTKSGSVMVMTGPTKIDYIGVDAGKLDLSRLRDIPEERVCAVLGVPAAVVGFGTGMQQTKVGATMTETRAMAYEDCIIPMQNLWCAEWDMQLLPEFEANPDALAVKFDNSKVKVLQEDMNRLSDRLTRQLQSGGLLLSQWREQLGYDTTPKDNVRFMPMSVTVMPDDLSAEATSSTDASSATPEGSEDEDQSTEEPANAEPPADAPKRFILRKSKRMSPQVAKLIRVQRRYFESESRAWAKRLTSKFKRYGRDVADAFLERAKAAGLKADAYEDIARATSGDVPIPDLEYKEEYIDIAQNSYKNVNQILGLGVNFTDLVEQRILARGGTRRGLVDIEQQTIDAIYDAIAQGRANGEGAQTIADYIMDMVAGGPWAMAETRAMMIARTEAKYAQNISSLDAYGSADNVDGILVFDAQLGPTDEECMALNGQIVTVEEAGRLAETEHPNGTRSFAPVVSES